jgi:hypothetical protein
LDLAESLETWADGNQIDTDSNLRRFFSDGFQIKQYTIASDAIRYGTRHDLHLAIEKQAEVNDRLELYQYSTPVDGQQVPAERRFGRIPLLAFCDSVWAEEVLREKMLSLEERSTWLGGFCAYIATFLVDPTGTAYIPNCLLRPSDLLEPGTWLAPEYWATARTPMPFWFPLLYERTPCEDDERGHFCFPHTLPEIEHHWSMTPFTDDVRSWAKGRYTADSALYTHLILRDGSYPAMFLSRAALDQLRDRAGEHQHGGEPFYCGDVWVDAYERDIDAVPVTQFYGLSTFAAYALKQDVDSGVLPSRCPQCGTALVVLPRQHRDRLCPTCAETRRRLSWRKAKRKIVPATGSS